MVVLGRWPFSDMEWSWDVCQPLGTASACCRVSTRSGQVSETGAAELIAVASNRVIVMLIRSNV